MIKKLILSLAIILGYMNCQANKVWYENAKNKELITFLSASQGTFSTDQTNPETTGINTNETVSKFVRDGGKSPKITFELPNPVTDFTDFKLYLKAYISMNTSALTSGNSKIRMYLVSTAGSVSIYEQLNFTEGETWQQFLFDFTDRTIPEEVIEAGGFDRIFIGLASGDDEELTTTYYIDRLLCTDNNSLNGNFMAGEWGVRFRVLAGSSLDTEVLTSDYIAGAQEIVDNLPSVGHVITNFTDNAHGAYFTLRTNEYVDIANEIHEDMVPSLENEQVILDVIDVFRDAGKKVILYLNTGGPQINNSDQDILDAWENYYTTEFDGDEAAAWRNLCKGFVERFDGLADGYWLDAVSSLPGGDVESFINMILDADSDALIGCNLNKSYITDSDGSYLYVDSDGVDDEDETDYKVISYKATDPYSDYTAGHITPLGQGAPPNSWAYEEFTIAEMEDSAWSSYDGSRLTVNHGWFPIRATWSSSRSDLMFDVEQAYRFVRRITDAGASMTWSTTVEDGFMTDDEMEIMLEIESRLQMSDVPDYIPYSRPDGAYLVGETPQYIWYENFSDTEKIEYTSSTHGTYSVDVSNPETSGVNTNWTATYFKRDGETSPKITYNLSDPITDLSDLEISLKAYINMSSSSLTNTNSRVRIFLKCTDTGESMYKQLYFSEGKTWENFTFDFTNSTMPDDVSDAGGYDQIILGVASGDIEGLTTTYYFDRIESTINQSSVKSANTSTISESSALNELRMSPNPVTSSFTLSEEVSSVSVFNSIGQKVMDFNGSQISYDVSKLEQGVYILNVSTTEGELKPIQFIKQ